MCLASGGLPERVQRVVVNLAFQLGQSRLGKFVRFQAALEQGDWRGAARELEDSRLYRQTPKRVRRHMKVLWNA